MFQCEILCKCICWLIKWFYEMHGATMRIKKLILNLHLKFNILYICNLNYFDVLCSTYFIEHRPENSHNLSISHNTSERFHINYWLVGLIHVYCSNSSSSDWHISRSLYDHDQGKVSEHAYEITQVLGQFLILLFVYYKYLLCYKSEGRWFDPSWCHWNFSLI